MNLPHLPIDNWNEFTSSDAFQNKFLGDILPDYLQRCRWYGAKSAPVRRYNAEVIIPLTEGANTFYLIILEVIYETANTENYLLSLGKCNASGDFPEAAKIATLEEKGDTYLLADGLYDQVFRDYLFKQMVHESSVAQTSGSLDFSKGHILSDTELNPLDSKILNAEQSNTTLVFNDKYFLKIYRKLFRDANPDYELTYFLSEQAGFDNCPKFAGSVTWNRKNSYEVTIGLMQGKIENQGDAWNFMLGEVKKYFHYLEDHPIDFQQAKSHAKYKPLDDDELADEFKAAMSSKTIASVKKLAQRTAEMHLALYKEKFTRRFIPKAFNTDYKAWLLNRFIYHLDHRFHLMENNMHRFKGEALEYAQEFLKYKPQIKDKILNFHSSELNSMRIRIHGDYHLGQVILQGDDFFILDFEGEPEATIRDRKVKQPPMKDVAGMFRSYHYAIYANIFDPANNFKLSQEKLFEAGEYYYTVLVGIFLNEYTNIAFEQGLDIGYHQEIDFLLRYHLLEKGIYELGYEINSRPDWVVIPLKGVLEIIKQDINEQ